MILLTNSQIMAVTVGYLVLIRVLSVVDRHVTKLMDYVVNCTNAINVLILTLVLIEPYLITMSVWLLMIMDQGEVQMIKITVRFIFTLSSVTNVRPKLNQTVLKRIGMS